MNAPQEIIVCLKLNIVQETCQKLKIEVAKGSIFYMSLVQAFFF